MVPQGTADALGERTLALSHPMNRLFYSALITLLLPLLFVRLWLKGKRAPNYRLRWAERLGYFNAPDNIAGGVCFHCVSVGETIAAISLIKRIQTAYPDLPVTITSTTPTGSDRVKAAFGDSVFHVYLPFDTPGAVRRFYRKLQPALLVILETELWPNLLHHAKRNGVKTVLANARLSPKSAKGYGKVDGLTRAMLNNLDKVVAHHQEDGERFVNLGLDESKLVVTGSIKFDITVDDAMKQRSQGLLASWPSPRPIWVVGSTHEGEDEQILAALKQIHQVKPDTLLVLVPRHPERFDDVAALVEQQGFKLHRRSNPADVPKDVQVILGDSMGELMLFWGAATVAFVGGSLIPRGGHNPLEPAAFAVPVLSGPNVFNFAKIYQKLEDNQAVKIVENSGDLAEAVIHLLQDHDYCRTMGNNGSKVVEQNRGALDKLEQQIRSQLR